MIEFETLEDVAPGTWDAWIAATGRGRIYHSSAWMAFLHETQPGRPVWARVHENGRPIGFFAGRVLRKYGLRILGSPLPGWTTHYMGPILEGDRPFSLDILRGLDDWVFRSLRCVHFETLSPDVPVGLMESLGYKTHAFHSFLLDLRQDETSLFRKFNKGCKWSIHKAQREGLTFEEGGDEEFIQDYYAQLVEVFARQRLPPTYPPSRVEALLRHLRKERVLFTRIRHPDGRCLATGIVPYDSRSAYLWGAASWRNGQKHCPNELLQWHLMRRLRELQIPFYDFGGGGEYKAKYRGARICVAWFYKSRYKPLAKARDLYQSAFYARQRLKGWFNMAGASGAIGKDGRT